MTGLLGLRGASIAAAVTLGRRLVLLIRSGKRRSDLLARVRVVVLPWFEAHGLHKGGPSAVGLDYFALSGRQRRFWL